MVKMGGFYSKKKKGWSATKSKCPQCQVLLERFDQALKSHFILAHGREPSAGEYRQFLSYREAATRYESGDFIKPRAEVSGGGVSPK